MFKDMNILGNLFLSFNFSFQNCSLNELKKLFQDT